MDACEVGGGWLVVIVLRGKVEQVRKNEKYFADIRLLATALATVGEEDRTPP